jgi:hypothetical protein
MTAKKPQRIVGDMSTRVRSFLVAWSCVVFATAGAGAGPTDVRLSALASTSQVYVDFAITAPIVDGLDARSLERTPTVVKWEVDLRPIVNFWRSRAVRRTTVEVIVRPAHARGTCQTSRQVNGRWIESRQVIGCAAAYAMISSFDLPLFPLAGLEPGSFDVTIRGTISAAGAVTVKTPVLARARVISSSDQFQ